VSEAADRVHAGATGLFERAVQLQREGKGALADALCMDVLRSQPDHAPALHLRGVLALESGQTEPGISLIRQSLRIAPNQPAAYSNLGNALLGQRRTDEALRCFEAALRLQPNLAEALFNRGVALTTLGRAGEAVDSFDRALEVRANDARIHGARAYALLQLDRSADALAGYGEAVRLAPNDPAINFGRGIALHRLERFADALAAYDQALAAKPDFAEALTARAGLLSAAGRHEQAAAAYERLLEVSTDADAALVPLVNARLQTCDWRDLDRLVARILACPARACALGGDLLAITDRADAQLQAARAMVPAAPENLRVAPRYAHERIRLAYVSGDLGEHAVSFLLAGVFEAHDRDRFELFGVALRKHSGSGFDTRIRCAFPQLYDVGDRTDAEVAELLRRLEVDIAVDLQGHTAGARLSLYAHRVAPVQVNYLGYPGTMGTQFWDYIIADSFLIPEASRGFYAERVAYLPDCFQANDDRRPLPGRRPRRSEVALPESGLILACLNASNKLTAPMFDIWVRLLKAAPGAVRGWWKARLPS
jgi:protein O-GlcNAc transferase